MVNDQGTVFEVLDGRSIAEARVRAGRDRVRPNTRAQADSLIAFGSPLAADAPPVRPPRNPAHRPVLWGGLPRAGCLAHRVAAGLGRVLSVKDEFGRETLLSSGPTAHSRKNSSTRAGTRGVMMAAGTERPGQTVTDLHFQSAISLLDQADLPDHGCRRIPRVVRTSRSSRHESSGAVSLAESSTHIDRFIS